MGQKDINTMMYRDYDIAEWTEKELVLSSTDREQLLEDLNDNMDSHLVAMARLPFPKFARQYLERFPDFSRYLKDPAFTYKLFLLKNSSIAEFCALLRRHFINDGEQRFKYASKSFDFGEVIELLSQPFDVIPKLHPSGSRANPMLMKYLYLTQYIDYETAMQLGLKISSIFNLDRQINPQADGFELEKKLSTLNLGIRLIFVKALGLYGNPRQPLREIANELKIPVSLVEKVYDELIHCFGMTLGDFKNKTGYIEKPYAIDETREYSSDKFRKIDLDVQTKFVLNNLLSPEERLVLSTKSNQEVKLYIVSKYIYKDDKKARSALSLSQNTAIPDFQSETSITLSEEEISVSMYYDHGISEWIEKSAILYPHEKEEMQKCLMTGMRTPLLDMVRLPFPKFATRYFEQYPKAQKYLKDPAFGYKLYLLTATDLSYFSSQMRKDVLPEEQKVSTTYYKHIKIFELTLDQIAQNDVYSKPNSPIGAKFLYLTQYINFEEAQRLGMKLGARCAQDNEMFGVFRDGYELFAKLDTLNFVARYIISRAIGLCGHKQTSLSDIAKELNLNYKKVSELYGELSPSLLRTLGEFKHKIGYVEAIYQPYELRDYRNMKLRELDLYLLAEFAYKFKASEKEREALQIFGSHTTAAKLLLYIVHKYISKGDVAQTMRLLPVTQKDIEKAEEMAQEKMKQH